MSDSRRGRGRPPRSRKGPATERIVVLVTAEELQKVDAAATLAELDRSGYVRKRLGLK